MIVEGDVMGFYLGRPDSQPEPELNVPANPDATSRTDMETGADDRRVRLGEEGAEALQDRKTTVESHGKTRRRAVVIEYSVPVRYAKGRFARASPDATLREHDREGKCRRILDDAA